MIRKDIKRCSSVGNNSKNKTRLIIKEDYRGIKNLLRLEKVEGHFFHAISLAFQGILTAFILMSLMTLSGAQPVHTGLRRILQRQQRHVKPTISPSARSRPCNHNSGHTATSNVSLCYKNGWFLVVYDNGVINGTSDARSPDSKSACFALLALKYLCLNNTAHIESDIHVLSSITI